MFSNMFHMLFWIAWIALIIGCSRASFEATVAQARLPPVIMNELPISNTLATLQTIHQCLHALSLTLTCVRVNAFKRRGTRSQSKGMALLVRSSENTALHQLSTKFDYPAPFQANFNTLRIAMESKESLSTKNWIWCWQTNHEKCKQIQTTNSFSKLFWWSCV